MVPMRFALLATMLVLSTAVPTALLFVSGEADAAPICRTYGTSANKNQTCVDTEARCKAWTWTWTPYGTFYRCHTEVPHMAPPLALGGLVLP